MLTAEDREIRRGKITGSIAGACLGLDPFSTPLAAWLEIMGRRPEDTDAGSRARKATGHILEPALVTFGAQAIADDTRAVVAVDRCGTIAHPSLAWAACSTDAIYTARPVEVDEAPRVVQLDDIVIRDPSRVTLYLGEAKDINAEHAWRWGEPWTDQIPAHVAVQCTWELLHVPEAAAVVLPVLLGASHDLRCYVWRRDIELEDACVSTLERWHARHVVGDTPPEATPADADIIGAVWRASGRRMPDTDPRVRDLVRADVEARARKLAAEAERDAIKVALGSILQDATSCGGAWGSVTWNVERGEKRTDWDAVNAGLHARHPGAAGTLANLLALHTTQEMRRTMRTTTRAPSRKAAKR